MQIHNGCKIVVLIECYERFFQTKLFDGTSGNGKILFLCERNAPLVKQQLKKSSMKESMVKAEYQDIESESSLTQPTRFHYVIIMYT